MKLVKIKIEKDENLFLQTNNPLVYGKLRVKYYEFYKDYNFNVNFTDL